MDKSMEEYPNSFVLMIIRVEHSIHTLCMNGDLESVMELIDSGTDINVGSQY